MSQQIITLRWFDPLKVCWSVGWRYFVYKLGLMGIFAAILFILTYLNVDTAAPEINSKLMIFFFPFELYIYYLPYKRLNGLTYRNFTITFPQPNTMFRRLKLILSYFLMSVLATAPLILIFLTPLLLVPELKESIGALVGLGSFMVVSMFVVNYFILRCWMTTGIFGQHLILVPPLSLRGEIFENGLG